MWTDEFDKLMQVAAHIESKKDLPRVAEAELVAVWRRFRPNTRWQVFHKDFVRVYEKDVLNMKTSQILFAIAVAGVAALVLSRLKDQGAPAVSKQPNRPMLPLDRKIVVLVLPAVKAVEIGLNRVDSDRTSKIYRNAQWMWSGREAEFKRLIEAQVRLDNVAMQGDEGYRCVYYALYLNENSSVPLRAGQRDQFFTDLPQDTVIEQSAPFSLEKMPELPFQRL